MSSNKTYKCDRCDKKLKSGTSMYGGKYTGYAGPYFDRYKDQGCRVITITDKDGRSPDLCKSCMKKEINIILRTKPYKVK